MSKRIIASLLCVLMLFGLTACGASDMMAKIRDESGVKTSTGSSEENEYDAGRPEDEPVIEATTLTLHIAEEIKLEDSETYDLDNVYVGWTIVYPEDIPSQMKKKLISLKDGYLPGGDGSDIIALAKANRGQWVSYTVEIDCQAYEEGYYSVKAYVTDNLNKDLRWNKYLFLSCFDEDINMLALSDVFDGSFDYGSYITGSIQQYWLQSYASDGNFLLETADEGNELSDEYAAELYVGGTFTLDEEGLLFATPLIDITEKTEDSDEVNSYASSVSVSIPYSEIEAEMSQIFK